MTLTRRQRRMLATMHGNATEVRSIRQRLHATHLRFCVVCHRVKPLEDFYTATRTGGHQTFCIRCNPARRTKKSAPHVDPRNAVVRCGRAPKLPKGEPVEASLARLHGSAMEVQPLRRRLRRAGRKACSACLDVKPLTAFNRCAVAADGRQYRCRPCGTKRERKPFELVSAMSMRRARLAG